MWATVAVGKHRQAQGQARQAQSRRENRYVIKVMRLNVKQGRDTFPRFARTKKVPSLLIVLYLIRSIFRLTYECKAGLKWNTGYLL